MSLTDGQALISSHAYAEHGVPARSVDAHARRIARALVRAPGLLALLGDHQARRHLRGLEAARSSSSPRRRHRDGSSSSRRGRRSAGRTARASARCGSIIEMDPPEHRQLPQGREPGLHAAGGQGHGRGDREERARHRRPARGRNGRGRVRLRQRRRRGGPPAAHPVDHARRAARERARHPAPHQPALRLRRPGPPARGRARIDAAGHARCSAWSSTSSSTGSSRTGGRTRPTTSRACSRTPQIDGEPMGPMETLGYFLITFTAGHDTTKNCAGGRHARVPREPGPVREAEGATPSSLDSAVEEVVRWTSPVNHMKRSR